MSVLIVGGVTVPVATDGASKRPPERIGFRGRAYAGNMRVSYKAEKRVFTIKTDLMLDASAATIEALITLGSFLACSGDVLGSSGTFLGEMGDSSYMTAFGTDGKGFMRSLAFTLYEV
jgi:hypothetical protein